MSNALASLVVNIKGDVANLLDAVTKGEGALGKLGGAAGKIGTLAAGGAAAAGAAVAGIGVSAFNAATDVQNATSKMQAQLGIGADEARELGGTIKDVFKNNFSDSIAEVGAAVTTVAQQFQGLPASLTGPFQTVTENAFRLRDAFGVEVPQSIDAVKTLMQNFGLTSEQAFDLVTQGFQKGLDRSGDFLDTINEYSTQFANGGATAEQFFGLLESGLQGGVLGTDKAADAFKEFRVRIQDGSTTTSDALKLLGIDTEDLAAKMADGSVSAADAFNLVLGKLRETDDQNIRMQAGVGLLGTQFEDLGTKGALGLQLIGDGFTDAAGKTQALDVQYSSLGNLFETLKRKAIVEWLVPMGDKILEVANQHGPAIAQGFAAVGEVLGQGAAKAQEFADKVGPPIREAIGEAVNFVRDNWPEIQRIIVDSLGPIVDEVGQTATVIGDRVQAVVGFFRDHWSQIEPIVRPILEALKTAIEGILVIIGGVITTALNIIQGDWEGTWNGIKQTAEGVWILIKGAVELGLSLIPAVIDAGMALVKGAWDRAWDAIKDGVGALWTAIKDGVTSGIGTVATELGTLGAKALAAVGDLTRTLYQKGVDLIAGFLAGIADKAREVPGAIAGAVGGALPNLPNPFSSRFMAPDGPLAQVGRGVVEYAMEEAKQVVALGGGAAAAAIAQAAKFLSDGITPIDTRGIPAVGSQPQQAKPFMVANNMLDMRQIYGDYTGWFELYEQFMAAQQAAVNARMAEYLTILNAVPGGEMPTAGGLTFYGKSSPGTWRPFTSRDAMFEAGESDGGLSSLSAALWELIRMLREGRITASIAEGVVGNAAEKSLSRSFARSY